MFYFLFYYVLLCSVIILFCIFCLTSIAVLCAVNSGDILIFMPGQEDIEVTCELISGIFVMHVFLIPVVCCVEQSS